MINLKCKKSRAERNSHRKKVIYSLAETVAALAQAGESQLFFPSTDGAFVVHLYFFPTFNFFIDYRWCFLSVAVFVRFFLTVWGHIFSPGFFRPLDNVKSNRTILKAISLTGDAIFFAESGDTFFWSPAQNLTPRQKHCRRKKNQHLVFGF